MASVFLLIVIATVVASLSVIKGAAYVSASSSFSDVIMKSWGNRAYAIPMEALISQHLLLMI